LLSLLRTGGAGTNPDERPISYDDPIITDDYLHIVLS